MHTHHSHIHVTNYSHPLSKPNNVDFRLCSSRVQGAISVMKGAIADQTNDIVGIDQTARSLSRRAFRDAMEMKEMLETVVAEMMVVGVERNQFQFTMGIECLKATGSDGIMHFDGLKITAGELQHTQEPYIKDAWEGHYSLLSETTLKADHNGNAIDKSATDTYRNTPYYLYAVIQAETGEVNMELWADKKDGENDEAYLLLGILSSEFLDRNTSLRVFNRSNGFTQIAGGTITTEQLQDPTRQLIIDMSSNPPRIIAKRGAQIIGNITFISSNGTETNLATKIDDMDDDISDAMEAAEDAMEKANSLADDGIISGGTEKSTLKKEWQEIAGSNYDATSTDGSYYKAKQQAAAYGVSTTTLGSKFVALKTMLDAILADMNTDYVLANGDAAWNTKDKFIAKWRDYYDAEIALLNTVSDTIDQKEIGGENLYTKADPLTVNVGATVRTGVYLTANKTYVISIGSKTGTGKITIFGVAGSTYTSLGEIPSAAFSKQWYTILKPTSNGELGFYEQSNTGAENHTLSLIMLQEGEKPTTYQNTYKFLAEAFEHDATKMTTSIDGGLIIAALLKLMNAQGNITAGISGLDDGLVLWGGGTYAQALSDVLGTTDILPVLLTTDPYGIGSKIGIFKIKKDSSYNHYIQVDNDGVPSIQMFKDRTAASVISELSPTTSFPAGSTQSTDKIKVVGKYYRSQSRWEYDHWVNNNYIETTTSWSRSASDSKTLLSRQMTLEASIYKFQSNVSFHPTLYASQTQLPNAGTYNGSASSSVTIRLTVTNVVTNEVVAQDSFSATPGSSQSFNKDFAITKSFTVPSKGTYSIKLTAALDASCAAPGSYNTPASDVEVYGEAQGNVTYNGGSLTNLSSRTVLCKDGFVYLCGGYNFTLRQDAESLDVRMVGLPTTQPSDSGRLWVKTITYKNAGGQNESAKVLCIT